MTFLLSRLERVWPYRWTLAALLLCVLVFSRRSTQIEATLPYQQHVDERHLSMHALRILHRSDWNPHFFRYPSLPIYGATLGYAVGAFRAASRGEIADVFVVKASHLGPYSHPSVVKVVRQLFLLVALCGLYLSGVLAARVTKRSSLRFFTPLTLCISAQFGLSSWSYLNVDIWAATLTLATLTWLAFTLHERTFVAKALVPALLSAATSASKYNAVVIVAPCLLTILWFDQPGRRMARALQLLALCVAFFVAFDPYSLLDTRAFLDGVLYEVHHYATGHPGQPPVEPGWSHWKANLLALNEQYGWALSGLSAWGVVALIRLDWRRAAVFLSASLLMLAMMSQQKVSFLRSLLPVIACLPLWSSLGALSFLETVRSLLGRLSLPPWLARHGLRYGLPLALVGVIWITTKGNWSGYVTVRDSRNKALLWISKRAEPSATVYIDKELMVVTDGLFRPERARTLAPAKLAAERKKKSKRPRYIIARAYDTDEHLDRALLGTKVVAKFGEGSGRNKYKNPKLTVRRIPPSP